MAFEGLKIEDINEAEISSLKENQVPEDRHLDYKRDLPAKGNDKEKRDFLGNISALANAGGGHLVFGIEEKSGVPSSMPGIQEENPDAIISQLSDIS